MGKIEILSQANNSSSLPSVSISNDRMMKSHVPVRRSITSFGIFNQSAKG
jgi:hypothetical protein